MIANDPSLPTSGDALIEWLTRAALTVATAAGDALVAQEGAFGTLLLAHDICEPPLMFGAAGVLNAAHYPLLTNAGFGIVPVPGSDTPTLTFAMSGQSAAGIIRAWPLIFTTDLVKYIGRTRGYSW